MNGGVDKSLSKIHIGTMLFPDSSPVELGQCHMG